MLQFFVAADLTVRNERLWYDKYRIRQSMIPSFIKMEQAEKILLVGKSINFLRLVCQDRTKLLQDRLQMSTDNAVNEDGKYLLGVRFINADFCSSFIYT